MLTQALEERTHSLEVSHRIGVQDDYIVEVGRHLFQTFYDLLDSRDESPG